MPNEQQGQSLTINFEEMQYINNLLMQMQYQHAAPIVNFFNVVSTRRQQEAQSAAAKKEIINAFTPQASATEELTAEDEKHEADPNGDRLVI